MSKFGIRSRLLTTIFSLVAILMLGLQSSPAHAQNDKCYGLSADDCAIVQGASNKGVTSFNMDYELTLVSSGGRGQDVDLSIKGSGPFEFDPKGADANNANPAAIAGAANRLTMQNTISISNKTKGQTKTNNIEFRVLNGTLYFEGDNLTSGKWKSVELHRLILGGLQRMGNRRNGSANGANPANTMQMLQSLHKLATIPGFVTAERTADTTMEKQQIATFVYHFDIATLLKSPDFADFVQSAMEMNSNAKMNPEQVKKMLPMLATTFKDTTFTLTHLIGVTDHLTHGVGVDIVVKLDPAMMRGMTGNMVSGDATGTAEANAAQPININFHFLLKMTGMGSKATVTAPDGATPMNLGSFGADTNGDNGSGGDSGSDLATPEATMGS